MGFLRGWASVSDLSSGARRAACVPIDKLAMTARRGRFRLRPQSEMLTRQGRNTPENEEDDELHKLDNILRDAGMLEENMTMDDKRTMYKVLQESKVVQVEKENHNLSLNSSHPPSNDPSSSRDQDVMPKSSRSVTDRRYSDGVMIDDGAETSTPQEPPAIPMSSKKVEQSDERRPGPIAGSTRKLGTVGRGRAVPTKGTKYPPLPVVSPGQKPQKPPTVHSSTPQTQPTSPSLTADARSIASAAQNSPLSSPSDRLGQQIASPPSPTGPEVEDLPRTSLDSAKYQQDTGSSVDIAGEGEDSHDDVVSDDSTGETQHGTSSSHTNEKVESPAPVKDGEEDDDCGAGGDQMEPVLTTQMGKLNVSVSPFQNIVRPISSMPVPPIFKELEELRGNEAEWTAQAHEICEKHQHAFWDKLLAESPWVTIRDGGINKRTLFKQETPKYSRFFTSSAEKQVAAPVLSERHSERQSKTRAMSKIQDALSETWHEPEFVSLRRSKQKDVRREDQTGNKQGSTTTRSDPEDDDEVQCLEDAPGGSGNIWQIPRVDQRRKPTDSDPDVAAEGGSSRDVYEFESDETWTPATIKNKKNNKRSGKTHQDDVEVEGRPSQRGRGSGGPPSSRGRNTKLRLSKGAIARPSEHATCSNNSRNKSGPPEHFEEDSNVRNNADSEDRVWGNRADTDNSNDISPGKFYSPKVIQPRNAPLSQSRGNPRENHRPNDFPTSPGSSGAILGRLQDEVAVIETVPCPICGKNFPKTEIEEHAGQCFNYSTGE